MAHKYNVDALDKSKPGETKELSDKGELDAGLYRHPQTGETLIAIADPLFGNPQADAAIRVGFVYERPAKPEEIKSIIEVAREERVSQSEESKSDKDRLDQLELAELRRYRADREKLDAEKLSNETISKAEENRNTTAADESAEDAKVAGEEAVAEREGVEGTPEDPTNEPVDEPTEEEAPADEPVEEPTVEDESLEQDGTDSKDGSEESK